MFIARVTINQFFCDKIKATVVPNSCFSINQSISLFQWQAFCPRL